MYCKNYKRSTFLRWILHSTFRLTWNLAFNILNTYIQLICTWTMNNVEECEYIHLAVKSMFLSKGDSSRISNMLEIFKHATNATRTTKHVANATRTAFRKQNALNCRMFSVHGFLLMMTLYGKWYHVFCFTTHDDKHITIVHQWCEILYNKINTKMYNKQREMFWITWHVRY